MPYPIPGLTWVASYAERRDGSRLNGRMSHPVRLRFPFAAPVLAGLELAACHLPPAFAAAAAPLLRLSHSRSRQPVALQVVAVVRLIDLPHLLEPAACLAEASEARGRVIGRSERRGRRLHENLQSNRLPDLAAWVLDVHCGKSSTATHVDRVK